MPSPSHQGYRTGLLFRCRARAADPDFAAQLERHRDACAVLWELDLEPARPTLAGCYAPNPRGGKSWDPIVLLRCLLFMVLVGQPSINDWVDDLTASRVLRAIAGLPEDRRPGVGTLYDFLHRLHDGAIRGTCEHEVRPSEAERRASRSPRPLQRMEKEQPAPKPKQERRSKRQRKQDKKDQKAAAAAALLDASVTQKLVVALKKGASSPNPNDLLGRLAAILLAVGVAGSAARGLLGDTSKLAVTGDGSPLRTGASKHGKRTCPHPKTERCDCPRIFNDPDARVGFDSYRNARFYGHHLYEASVNIGGHDLPLAIRLDAGNESDYTASVMTIERLRKDLGAMGMAIRYFIADAGHDGEANYRYCLGHDIIPVIALRGAIDATHPKRPEVKLSKRAIPTCAASVEMVQRGTAAKHRPIFACPVRNGKLNSCPIAPPEDPDWLCHPELKCGPTVTVKVDDNPRLFPPIPRNNPRHAELMKLRSGCERSNSVKKEVFKLEDARHRRASFWLMRLHFMAVLQHARAWVAAGAARQLVDQLLGREPIAKRA